MSKLIGEAKCSVAGILLSNENYAVVVELLKERYGDTQTNVTSHYTVLINLKSASNTVRRLRGIYNDIEKHLRSLLALEQDINQDIFISIITTKLPKDVLIQLEVQKRARNKWTVTELRKRLNDYVAARERAEQQSGAQAIENKTESQKPMIPTAETLVAGSRANGNKGERKKTTRNSRYCDGDHWNDECLRYTTVETRKNKLKGSCYICLKRNHVARVCPKDTTCIFCRRLNHHHRSLCLKQFSSVRKENSSLTEKVKTEDEIVNTKIVSYHQEKWYWCKLLKLILKTQKMDFKLKMGEKDEIMLVAFGSEKPKSIQIRATKLEVVLKDGSTLQITAHVVPQIAEAIQRCPVNLKSVENWKYLWTSFSLADDLPYERETSSVEILIGNDYYLDIRLPQKFKVQRGLYMRGSKLGWTLAGRASETAEEKAVPGMLILTYGSEIARETAMLTGMDRSHPVKPNVEDFRRLESIGINDSPVETDDNVALQRFTETLKYDNGRYKVTWPWKKDRLDLPENRTLALGRLKSLIHRMKSNPELLQKYDEIIMDQLNQGIIEKVKSQLDDNLKHYIPHHYAVINPMKTTSKIRVVYNATAKPKPENKSLNECLYQGPVMRQNLVGILFRFRMNKVALVSDIETAFLQIGLQDEAKDVTRFFWLRNRNKPDVDNNIEVYRFCRMPFGIISSPFLLAATIDHHLKSCNNNMASKITTISMWISLLLEQDQLMKQNICTV